MKQLFIIFTLTFASCVQTPTVEQHSIVPAPQITECSPTSAYFIGGYAVDVWRVKIDGHYYIGVRNINKNISGISHDPSCPCQK
jgi:hypothetical protein